MFEILLSVHFHNHSIKKLQIPFKQNILNLSIGILVVYFIFFVEKLRIFLSKGLIKRSF